MKQFTDSIAILVFRDSSVDYIDTVHDAETTYGCLTWRRGGQDIPKDMGLVCMVSVEDVASHNTDKFVERLIELNYGAIREDVAIAAVEKIYRSIRNQIPSGSGWGYRHSNAYDQLVKENKLREERLATSHGSLLPWEEDFFNDILPLELA